MGMSTSLVSLDAETSDESGSVADVYEDYTYSPDGEIMEACARDEAVKMAGAPPRKGKEDTPLSLRVL